MPSRHRQGNPDPLAVADRLHSAAIHLLRRLRLVDEAAGLSAPRLSALSVVVYAGPISMGALASAEQVRPPTMTRLVSAMERQGLLRRAPDPEDRRIQQVRATAKGRRLLEAGRRRRIETLAADLAELRPDEVRLLARAAELVDFIATRDRRD